MVRDLCSKRTAADKIMNKMNENRKIVLDTLNEQNIEYEMFEHQAVYTVDEIEDSDLWNHENGIGAKNLFLRDGSGKHHFLVIIREDKQADLKKVRDEIGSSRLSFASAERLMKYLNIEPGSVSPLGVLNDQECVIPVFFDEDLKEYEYIAVHPNDNTATIWMKSSKIYQCGIKFMNKKKNTRFFDFLRIEDYNVANIKSQKNKEKEGNEQDELL